MAGHLTWSRGGPMSEYPQSAWIVFCSSWVTCWPSLPKWYIRVSWHHYDVLIFGPQPPLPGRLPSWADANEWRGLPPIIDCCWKSLDKTYLHRHFWHVIVKNKVGSFTDKMFATPLVVSIRKVISYGNYLLNSDIYSSFNTPILWKLRFVHSLKSTSWVSAW